MLDVTVTNDLNIVGIAVYYDEVQLITTMAGFTIFLPKIGFERHHLISFERGRETDIP